MTTKPETLLTRRQVAALLGIGESEVKQKDGTIFHPTKAPDGSFRYAVEELLSVLQPPAVTEPETSPDGATCAAAFALFAEGKNLTETVIALKQPPTLVRALRAEFDSMAGTLTVPAETVGLIEAYSKSTVRNANQLLALIDLLRTERDTAYEQGLEDACDQGSVLDPRTGQMVPIGNLVPSPTNSSTSDTPPREGKE